MGNCMLHALQLVSISNQFEPGQSNSSVKCRPKIPPKRKRSIIVRRTKKPAQCHAYACTLYKEHREQTFRKQPTKLLCTLAPSNALGFTEPPTYTRDDDSIVNFPAICEWSVYTSSTTATNCICVHRTKQTKKIKVVYFHRLRWRIEQYNLIESENQHTRQKLVMEEICGRQKKTQIQYYKLTHTS